MGYLGNHLATVVTGVFAATLTCLWPFFVDFAPILNFIFIMAVPITWFLTFTCWISQRSTDYVHNNQNYVKQIEKKSLNKKTIQIYSPDGKHVAPNQLKSAQNELSEELSKLQESVKLKDGEIERLNEKILNLQTLVQIESLKTELANLKMLAFGSKSKNK